ncbi:MAG TPA: PAS domain-containing protein, partial [Blastocatellia bacterium]|nr:PAS domain-containing protein [Blastocatellia bacterium]
MIFGSVGVAQDVIWHSGFCSTLGLPAVMTGGAAAITAAGILLVLFAAIAFRSKRNGAALIDYRKVYENATVGIFRATPDGQIVAANSCFLELLGFESIELVTAGPFPGEHGPGIRDILANHSKGTAFDFTWTRPDRSNVRLRISARAVNEQAGVPQFYEGTVQNVTDFLDSANALKRRLDTYQSLFDQAATPFVVVNPRTEGILAINPSAQRLFGYSMSQVEGLSLRRIVTSSHTDNPPADWLSAPKIDLVRRTPEGREIRLRALSSAVDFDARPATLLILEELGDRITAESDALAASAFDSLPPHTYCKDLEGRYTFANKSFRTWAGKPMTEIVGKSDRDFFPESVARRLALVDNGITHSQEIANLVE